MDFSIELDMDEVEFIKEVRRHEFGRLVVTVSSVYHPIVGMFLAIRVERDLHEPLNEAESAWFREIMEELRCWMIEQGHSVVGVEEKRRQPQRSPVQ